MTASRNLCVAVCAAIFSGCALLPERTVYVEMEPECSAPAQPALPELSPEALDPLPDDVYWDVINRDARLQDWALEMRAVLREVCSNGGD